MFDFRTYRKFVDLRTGKRVMLRFLNEQDRERLLQLFRNAPEEDVRFSKQDVKNVELVNRWIDHLDYDRVLPLMAVDLDADCFIAEATLHRGKHTATHIGEIRIFVSRAYRGLGLGSLMLDELISLAGKLNFQILRAEVILDHKAVLNAFRSKGFEIKCTLDDHFLCNDGVAYDVVLLVRRLLKKEDMEFEAEP
jgi:L-amino acid N-acyltransferase YncA